MRSYTEKIREIAGGLLRENKVDMVIGFTEGTVPMLTEPRAVTSLEDVQELLWNSRCLVNLASYLTDRKEKIAVVAKGCDSRNIATHIIENKIKREQLTIIGVPCQGMIDPRKASALVDFEITELIEEEDKILVKGSGLEKTLDKAEILRDNCAACAYPNPVIYDELIAEKVEPKQDVERYADVQKVEEMETSERLAYFEDALSSCIRCYACRNACPLCYCPECFVDESNPQWVGKGDNPADIRTFHFLRAYHCAGRCTDCGSCETVCPMGINLRLLNKKLEKDCSDMFGWQAGLNTEDRPPLDSFNPNDPDDFVK